METKYNGFNNGRDKSDGIGGNPPEGMETNQTPEEKQPDTLKDENGQLWYSTKYFNDYCEMMMQREYQRGYKEGKQDIVHVAEITSCPVCDSMAERNRELESELLIYKALCRTLNESINNKK